MAKQSKSKPADHGAVTSERASGRKLPGELSEAISSFLSQPSAMPVDCDRLTVRDVEGRPRAIVGIDEAGNGAVLLLDSLERPTVWITKAGIFDLNANAPPTADNQKFTRRTTARGEASEALEGADKQWGFKFGCDGVMRFPDACKHLGISRGTLERRVAADLLRRGQHPGGGGLVICIRSMEIYKSGMEL
jgi:hypothetical protein